MFIIHRISEQGGGYVAKPGNPHSYVHNILLAQQYPTRQAAEANLCPDNERIEDLQNP